MNHDHTPFPLEGGRARDGGGAAPSLGRASVGAPATHVAPKVERELVQRTEAERLSPPSPTLPPSRGKGGGRPVAGSVGRARRLRKESTLAERILWEALRGLKLNFRRQVPIGRFIADFAHHDSKLLIEIDGHYHTVDGAADRDAARTAWLTAEGYRVIRFAEKDVRDDRDKVIRQILVALSSPQPICPMTGEYIAPSTRGKGEESSIA